MSKNFVFLVMNVRMITKFALIALMGAGILLRAAIPAGYYDDAAGKSGNDLRLALHNIIDGHTVLTYAEVWDAFATTDLKANGRIWDMYTGIEFVYGEDQSTGSEVYTTYNREHSWPKSWANESYPMYTDVFHLYPVQAYANSHRSNLPYGEVGTPVSYTSDNGTQKGDARDGLGYGGTVFEPIDEYKGDLARTYFYISTRYYTEDASWNVSPMTNKSDLEEWAVDMLLDWHALDPVSPKETDRNEAVYALQGNRNPFIDHPAYADSIWGTPGGEPPEPGADIDSTKIFFSEYIEGSSYNKAIEIYNNTDTVIDLSLLELRLYSNGSLTPGNTLTLSGSLPASSVYVIAHSSAGTDILAEADITTGGVANFNGNDALELRYHSQVTDVLGDVGSDSYYAQDITLVRKTGVSRGNTVYTDSEWNEYAKDETAYLGTHFVESGGPLPVTLSAFTASPGKGVVHLQWTTESETENAAFLLYRDGDLLQRIAGAGTRSQTRHYRYTDRGVRAGEHYRYVLADVDLGGKRIFHDTLDVAMPTNSEIMLPKSFTAGKVYPNPFNPAAVLPLYLHESAALSISLHDLRGRERKTVCRDLQLPAGERNIGLHTPELPAGMYILRVSDGISSPHTQKVLLLK